MSLHPCPSCGRHVRRSETTCPFCATALSFAGVPERGVPAVRLGRAATFAFGAAVATAGAASLVGCAAPAYGAPPRDTGVDATAGDAAEPVDAFAGGFDAAYGGPPIDASDPSDAGPPVDASQEKVAGRDVISHARTSGQLGAV